jgi:hypothetical protein
VDGAKAADSNAKLAKRKNEKALFRLIIIEILGLSSVGPY